MKDYTPEIHDVRGQGKLSIGVRVGGVKIYTMVPESGTRFSSSSVGLAKSNIAGEIAEERIRNPMNAGFAVLSPGYLNVSMWGGSFPSLLTPNLYSVDERGRLERLDVNENGAYCVWEARIVEHEAASWRRFLFSSDELKNSGDALRMYMNDFYNGPVGRRESLGFEVRPRELAFDGKINISTRTVNALEAAHLTFADTCLMSDEELKRRRNIGKVALEEIRATEIKLGLSPEKL